MGQLADVMWARPTGERVLVAPSPEAADFIQSVYTFDRVEIVEVDTDDRLTALDVRAGAVELSFRAGPGWRIPAARLRPAWVTRRIEAPLARRLLGVRTYGVSSTGVREWYRADEYRPLVSGRGSVAGRDLGAMRDIDRPTGFGFSEPPRRPSVVKVRPLLEAPRRAPA